MSEKPVFGFSILGIHFRVCILVTMHFVKNSTFGKILKLFIRSDYAERNCVSLVF
jgi:hypothetical protein